MSCELRLPVVKLDLDEEQVAGRSSFTFTRDVLEKAGSMVVFLQGAGEGGDPWTMAGDDVRVPVEGLEIKMY